MTWMSFPEPAFRRRNHCDIWVWCENAALLSTGCHPSERSAVPSTHSARRAVRLVVTTSLCASMAIATAVSAAAEPEPVYPSQQQVDSARAAASSTAAKVAGLDARYAAASARLAEVQTRAAAAAEAYNGARLQLAQKKKAAEA